MLPGVRPYKKILPKQDLVNNPFSFMGY